MSKPLDLPLARTVRIFFSSGIEGPGTSTSSQDLTVRDLTLRAMD